MEDDPIYALRFSFGSNPVVKVAIPLKIDDPSTFKLSVTLTVDVNAPKFKFPETVDNLFVSTFNLTFPECKVPIVPIPEALRFVVLRDVDVVTPVSLNDDLSVVVVIIPELILLIELVPYGIDDVISLTLKVSIVASPVTFKLAVVVNPLLHIFWAVNTPTVTIPVKEMSLDQATPPLAPDPFEIKNWPDVPASEPI